MKKFEDIQIGDIALDYNAEPFKVLDKGTAKDMCNKYKWRMSYGLADIMEEDNEVNKDTLVIVREFPEGDCFNNDIAIYVYADNGAICPA